MLIKNMIVKVESVKFLLSVETFITLIEYVYAMYMCRCVYRDARTLTIYYLAPPRHFK